MSDYSASILARVASRLNDDNIYYDRRLSREDNINAIAPAKKIAVETAFSFAFNQEYGDAAWNRPLSSLITLLGQKEPDGLVVNEGAALPYLFNPQTVASLRVTNIGPVQRDRLFLQPDHVTTADLGLERVPNFSQSLCLDINEDLPLNAKAGEVTEFNRVLKKGGVAIILTSLENKQDIENTDGMLIEDMMIENHMTTFRSAMRHKPNIEIVVGVK